MDSVDCVYMCVCLCAYICNNVPMCLYVITIRGHKTEEWAWECEKSWSGEEGRKQRKQSARV